MTAIAVCACLAELVWTAEAFAASPVKTQLKKAEEYWGTEGNDPLGANPEWNSHGARLALFGLFSRKKPRLSSLSSPFFAEKPSRK